MKYAENNRISHRQLYHQIILSFLAPLLICIPGYNGEQGLSGAVGISSDPFAVCLFSDENFLLLCRSCKNNGKAERQLVGKLFLNISDHDRSLYSFTH